MANYRGVKVGLVTKVGCAECDYLICEHDETKPALSSLEVGSATAKPSAQPTKGLDVQAVLRWSSEQRARLQALEQQPGPRKSNVQNLHNAQKEISMGFLKWMGTPPVQNFFMGFFFTFAVFQFVLAGVAAWNGLAAPVFLGVFFGMFCTFMGVMVLLRPRN